MMRTTLFPTLLVSLLTVLLAACGVNGQLAAVTPQVTAMHPEPGTVGVSTDTHVWIAFDTSVDPSWLAGSFTLTDTAGAEVAVAVAYDAATYTVAFLPGAALRHDTTYEASVVAAVASGLSSAGTLADDVVWSFTTEIAADAGQDEDLGDDTGEDEAGGEGDDETGGGDETGGDETGGDETGGDETGDETGGDDVEDADDTEGEACDADGNCVYTDTTLDVTTIPAGATWTLDGVVFTGALNLGAGATLHATGIVVHGKFESDGADEIVLVDSHVMGKVEFKAGGSVEVRGTTIDGTAEFKTNMGGVTLVDNVLGSTLDCTDNTPAPTGSGNVVAGTASGECAGF